MSGWSGTKGVPSSTINITLLGDPGSGKTSIKKNFMKKSFDDNEKITIGADFTFYTIPELPGIRLKIGDIAGQATFSMVRQSYLTRSDGALLVFDLTNPKSLENVKGWLTEYIKANRHNNNTSPVLLIGNKADLIDDRKIPISMVKNFLELAEENYLFTNRIIGYIETSARTGDNIQESFTKLTDLLVKSKND